jgi:hypothetical protein
MQRHADGEDERQFITLFGGAAAWPLGARAQQSLPVVEFLSSRSPEKSAHLVEAFPGGLKDGGSLTRGLNETARFPHTHRRRRRRVATRSKKFQMAMSVNAGARLDRLPKNCARPLLGKPDIERTSPNADLPKVFLAGYVGPNLIVLAIFPCKYRSVTEWCS